MKTIIYLTLLFIVIIIGTCAVSILLSAASWIENILGIIIIPSSIYCIYRIIKLIFKL